MGLILFSFGNECTACSNVAHVGHGLVGAGRFAAVEVAGILLSCDVAFCTAGVADTGAGASTAGAGVGTAGDRFPCKFQVVVFKSDQS